MLTKGGLPGSFFDGFIPSGVVKIPAQDKTLTNSAAEEDGVVKKPDILCSK